jgi:arabinogalactan endo-1,4-beta-galactosidase
MKRPCLQIFRKIRFAATGALLLFCMSSCYKNNNEELIPEVPSMRTAFSESALLSTTSADFVKGADISHVTRMENAGKLFYNTTDQQDLFTIMKERGLNTIRIRVWVNSTGSFVYNSLTDVVAKAVRAKNAGLKVFVDFHYSDTWADPWKQTTPSAWSGYSYTQLKTAVSDHTTTTINALIANGVTPAFVEVGNEVDNGMLWPTGQIPAGNMANFAGLYKAGYDAVKAINPDIKVMVHFSKGFDNDSCKNVLNGLVANGADFDVIGLSVYPHSGNFATIMSQTNANMQDLAATYNKDIMIAECGYVQSDAVTCRLMISTLLTQVSNLADNRGIGVCYWEPQYYDRPPVNKSMFSSTTFNPTLAIDAFSLVKNPGFEVDNANTQNPINWTSGGANAEANYVETTAHSGTYRLTHYKNAAYNVSTSQTITGLPNGNYTFQAWVISPYAMTQNQLFAKDFGSAQINASIPVAAGWQKIKISNINVSNGQCTIGFYTDGNAKYCSFDDIQFFKQ